MLFDGIGIREVVCKTKREDSGHLTKVCIRGSDVVQETFRKCACEFVGIITMYSSYMLFDGISIREVVCKTTKESSGHRTNVYISSSGVDRETFPKWACEFLDNICLSSI